MKKNKTSSFLEGFMFAYAFVALATLLFWGGVVYFLAWVVCKLWGCL